MYEIYQKLLDEKGIKNADISRATGISNMTLSDWKNGKSTPKQDKLMKIADYFGVTVDYLVTGNEKEIPNAVLTDDFAMLIELYNSSNADGQSRIMEYAKMIAKEYKK